MYTILYYTIHRTLGKLTTPHHSDADGDWSDGHGSVLPLIITHSTQVGHPVRAICILLGDCELGQWHSGQFGHVQQMHIDLGQYYL